MPTSYLHCEESTQPGRPPARDGCRPPALTVFSISSVRPGLSRPPCPNAPGGWESSKKAPLLYALKAIEEGPLPDGTIPSVVSIPQTAVAFGGMRTSVKNNCPRPERRSNQTLVRAQRTATGTRHLMRLKTLSAAEEGQQFRGGESPRCTTPVVRSRVSNTHESVFFPSSPTKFFPGNGHVS